MTANHNNRNRRNVSQILFSENTIEKTMKTELPPKKHTRRPGEPLDDDELICLPCENDILSKSKKKPENIVDFDNTTGEFHVIKNI